METGRDLSLLVCPLRYAHHITSAEFIARLNCCSVKRSRQEQTGAHRSTQEHTGADRSRQEHTGAHRSRQEQIDVRKNAGLNTMTSTGPVNCRDEA